LVFVISSFESILIGTVPFSSVKLKTWPFAGDEISMEYCWVWDVCWVVVCVWPAEAEPEKNGNVNFALNWKTKIIAKTSIKATTIKGNLSAKLVYLL